MQTVRHPAQEEGLRRLQRTAVSADEYEEAAQSEGARIRTRANGDRLVTVSNKQYDKMTATRADRRRRSRDWRQAAKSAGRNI